MFVLCFSIFTTLILLGSRTSVNAQNCAIPSLITLPENDTRAETAEISTILGAIQTFNVLEIKSLDKEWEDFIDYKIEPSISIDHSASNQQRILLLLKRPLKNELDDKRRNTIESTAVLACEDGRNKTVRFSVGMKDENTKCPQFVSQTYNCTVNIDELNYGTNGEVEGFTCNEPIIITDGDRDRGNAVVDISYDALGKDFYITVSEHIETQNDEHTFRVLMIPKEGVTFKQGERNLILKVENLEPMKQSITCNGDIKSTTYVVINFITNNSTTPEPKPEPHLGGPPIFSSFYYYAVVKDFSEAYNGSILKVVQPSAIKAIDPDGLHEISYGFLPADEKTKGILDIDYRDATVRFNSDLTKEYVCGLKDSTEIYKITAYISETWLRSTMEFSFVPLVVFYDLHHSGNDTGCPEVTSPPPTNPSSPPTPPSTSTTTSSSTPTTTSPPPTITPVFPTSTASEETTTTGAETTESQGGESTTVDGTSTWPSTSSGVTDFTSEMTSQQTEITTSEISGPTETPTTPQIIDPTTTPIESTSTTDFTSQQTEESSTETPGYNQTSTTPNPNECPVCSVKEEYFKCETEGVFGDPRLCNLFHQCVPKDDDSNSHEWNGLQHIKQKCPPYTGFNKATQQCEYPPRCECQTTKIYNQDESDEDEGKLEFGVLRGYGDGDDSSVTPPPECPSCGCGYCYQVGPGESVCDGTSMLYPDPHNCKIFHSCRSDGHGGYIDCVMECPPLTAFCPDTKVCIHESDVTCIFRY